MPRVHAAHFRATVALAAALTSGAGALAGCGSATEHGLPAGNAAATSAAPGAAEPAGTAAAPAHSAKTTATGPAATTPRAPVRAQPGHRAHKKTGRRVVLPSHLILPPPPVHHLVTPLMPLRVHPMTSPARPEPAAN